MQAHGKTLSLPQSKSLRDHGLRQKWKVALRERMSSPPQSGHFRRNSFMGVERRISQAAERFGRSQERSGDREIG
jgi:hypothetical protein